MVQAQLTGEDCTWDDLMQRASMQWDKPVSGTWSIGSVKASQQHRKTSSRGAAKGTDSKRRGGGDGLVCGRRGRSGLHGGVLQHRGWTSDGVPVDGER